ncbi:MAG: hypothetical protein WBP59_03815, partial [Ilumatobacteraceae bacterium]
HVDGLYVIANMWWEPVEFTVQVDGAWRRSIDTSAASGLGDGAVIGRDLTVAPRSIVVLTA